MLLKLKWLMIKNFAHNYEAFYSEHEHELILRRCVVLLKLKFTNCKRNTRRNFTQTFFFLGVTILLYCRCMCSNVLFRFPTKQFQKFCLYVFMNIMKIAVYIFVYFCITSTKFRIYQFSSKILLINIICE